MENKEYKLNLWKEFMEKDAEITKMEKEVLGEIAAQYKEDTSFLMNVYKCFIENGQFLMDEDKQVSYEKRQEWYMLSNGDQKICLEKEQFRKILISMLDILEDTLPLGTVVDLKKDIYKATPEMPEVETIRMVITHRFLGREEDTYYYPYGGIVYPTGMLGRKEILYFTRSAVERVMQRGYQDEQEEVFVYLMKKDLIIDGGGNSLGYATREEIEKRNRAFREEQGDE